MSNKVSPRMYLILREDLAYKYIQGGHALAKFGLQYRNQFHEWNNEYLICLSVFNGLSLKEVHEMLLLKIQSKHPEIAFSVFNEPDLLSELPTAIAIFENGAGIVSKTLEGLKLATK